MKPVRPPAPAPGRAGTSTAASHSHQPRLPLPRRALAAHLLGLRQEQAHPGRAGRAKHHPRQFQVPEPGHPGPRPVRQIIEQALARGDLVLDFSLRDELPEIARMLRKYRDQGMDLADACVVRMSEIHRACRVLTVDVADSNVYRRFGNREVPRVTPEHSD